MPSLNILLWVSLMPVVSQDSILPPPFTSFNVVPLYSCFAICVSQDDIMCVIK